MGYVRMASKDLRTDPRANKARQWGGQEFRVGLSNSQFHILSKSPLLKKLRINSN